VAVLFALGFAMTAATIYGAATLQETLDLAPATAGLALLPWWFRCSWPPGGRRGATRRWARA